MPSPRLADRVVLVAGATGMAEAAAERAAAEGARVFVVSRTPDHAAALADRLTAGGHDADWVAADLRHEADARRAVEGARELLRGRVRLRLCAHEVRVREHAREAVDGRAEHELGRGVERETPDEVLGGRA